MIEFNTKIEFKKFNPRNTNYHFLTGINIVYGESGVGKSTLLDAFQGKDVPNNSNFNISILSNKLDVYRIFQNPDHQIISSTVCNEITFSGECRQLPPNQLKIILDNNLKNMPNKINPFMNPGYLSGGEKEILNLLTALDHNPEVLLIDDGLSFLSRQNKVHCLNLMKKWIADSSGIIIWVTSDYEDLELGDSCWEIRLDSFVKIDEISENRYDNLNVPAGFLNLDIKDLSFRYEQSRYIYSNLSMSIENARSLGLLGDNGSGKTTFSGLCFGDLIPAKGKIALTVNGEKDIKIGYLDQFPEHLILLKSPEELLSELKKKQIFNKRFENTFKNRLKRFGIQWNLISDTRGLDLPWPVLRILLVILLVHCHFDLIILDEPTFGLGFRQKENFRLFLRECMSQVHFMIVSHDKKFIKATCDNVIDLDNLDNKYQKIEREEKIKP
ncbi:MAG: ATP-binding cassette domain-containing protein [Candidatus Neomarinimicrobiota bacterium]